MQTAFLLRSASGAAPQATFSGTTPTTFGWHLKTSATGGFGIGAEAVWPDYTGKGVTVGVYDDGIDRGGAAATYGKHGTAVAGIIAGGATSAAPGIAYDATTVDKPVIGLSLNAITAQLASQRQFDIVNHSWGWSAAFYADAGDGRFKPFFATFEDAAAHGRDGLGTLINIAAGNFKADGLDTNASNLSSERHATVVAAVTSEGTATSYSSQGASIWIAAPSGGGAKGGILTADKPGAEGYGAGDTTNRFSGTSAATPQVSGVQALMLEANPNLGWRDVKTILALSAQASDLGKPVENGATLLNGGGLRFSNDVGFGVLDARAAVRLAETWVATSTSANEASVTGATQLGASARIADQTVTTFTIQMKGGVSVETVELSLDGYHGRASDLVIELISPSGTVATVLSGKNGGNMVSDWTFTANAFLGEASEGTWTVRVTDKAAGQTGLVHGFSLTAYGAADNADDLYVFTDDFARTDRSTVTLVDAAGSDIVNASAVTSDSVIDLRPGATSTIDGRALVIGRDTIIETAFGGDGDDTITAHDNGAVLWGGRGDDTLRGGRGDDIIIDGAGNDRIDGGGGTDALRLAGDYEAWTIGRAAKSDVFTLASGSERNEATAIERFVFDDMTLALDTDGAAGQGFRIYQASFARTPDLAGLSYWIGQLDKGANLNTIASAFIGSREFAQVYGTNLDDGAFVAALYKNVQGRTGEAAGLTYWTEALGSGAMDRASVLVAFSESAENIARSADVLAEGVLVANAYLLV